MTRALTVLAAGAAGGAIFRLLHLPLPWTLGALAAAALLSLRYTRMVLPPVFRDGARPVIGVMAGSAFSPVVLGQISSWWPIFLLLIVFFLVLSALGAGFFRWMGFDTKTALFASMPGGLGEMTFLGAQFGANVRHLVLVHSVRIVIVVTLVPFIVSLLLEGEATAPPAAQGAGLVDWALLIGCTLLGYLAGRRLRSFGGLMLVPMLFSAVVHGIGLTEAAVPYWLIAAMQVVIGCITGARFAGIRFSEARRVLGIGAAWALILIGLSALLAFVTAGLMDRPPAALFLALSPGGFAEMSIIAYASGIDVAFVVTCHAFRTLYVMLVAPTLCRLILR